MPAGTGIDEEEAQVQSEATNETGLVHASQNRSSSGKLSKGSDSIATAIQHLTSARQKSTNELLKALVASGNAGNEDSIEKKTSDEQYEMVGRIMEMRKAVKASEDDIVESKKKRSKIEEKYADNPLKRSKKLKKINKEIEEQEKVKDTLKTTMMQYTAELARLNTAKSNVQKELNYSDSDIMSSSSSSGSEDE